MRHTAWSSARWLPWQLPDRREGSLVHAAVGHQQQHRERGASYAVELPQPDGREEEEMVIVRNKTSSSPLGEMSCP